MRNHRQGGSEATVIESRSEGAKRPCAIIGRSERSDAQFSGVRERSDRSRASGASVRTHTSSDGGSEATVRHHQAGASEASGIVPHI